MKTCQVLLISRFSIKTIMHHLKYCLLLVGSGFAVSGNSHLYGQAKKPNVLILLSDQHQKKVMGFEGHPDVITPNLDRFAKESLVFNRAYCPTGISSASRSALMTGLYPRTLGLLSNSDTTEVMKEVVSMASIFKHNGYNTYAFGKRHAILAIDEGWDVCHAHQCEESPGQSYVEWIDQQGFSEAFANDWAAEFGRGPDCSPFEKTVISFALMGTRLSQLPDGYTMEAYTARLTIDMIREQAQLEKPFFCWATFYRPHQPYTPVKKYMDLYDVSGWGNGTRHNSRIKKPATLYEPEENLPPQMQDIRHGHNRIWRVDKAFEDEQLWRNYIGAYYALVSEIDHYIGQILQTLSDTRQEQETIVIYMSDHGDFVGNHGMIEKAALGQNVYEDILNIPLIFHYPGKTKTGSTEELVTNVDVLPTLIDMLDLEVPSLKFPFQGHSLRKVITGIGSLKRDYVVSESWSQATVITADYKLGIMLDPTKAHPTWDYRKFGDMFFVSKNDPVETHNLAKDNKYSKIIRQLKMHYEHFTRTYPDIGKQELCK